MKVLHVNHLLDPMSGGGTAERTFQLSHELAKMGVECTILTLDIGRSHSRAVGIERLCIKTLPCIYSRFFVPKASLRQIISVVENADIVQIFGNWTVLNFLVWRACLQLGKPYVFCPAGALPVFGRSNLLKRIYSYWITRGILRDAARCVCITEDERSHFLDLDADNSRIDTISNGIDPQNYYLKTPSNSIGTFRAGLGIGAAPFILFLGRLNSIKGPDLLLEAFASLANKWPAHHLVLGGPDGGMLWQLREFAIANGLIDRVHFTGFLEGEAKSAALHAAELLVIPSRSEAMSIVVLEAGATGTPVLFSDACGLGLFERRGVGTMVLADARSIELGLDGLLGQTAMLNAQGAQLKRLVLSEFQWCDQARRHMSMYEQILKKADHLFSHEE